MSHRNIDKLGQLGDGDVGDVDVVCFALYFMRLCLYAVNSKEVPWKEITVYHLASLIWFTIFDRCAETMKINQSKRFVGSIGGLFLFPRSDYHNPRLETSESY